MDRALFVIGGVPVTTPLLAATVVAAVLALVLILGGGGRTRALEGRLAEIGGRLQAMAEGLGTRQADFAKLVAERLDGVGARVGQRLDATGRATTDQLALLGERLAVIDRAQLRLQALTEDVVGLKDILSNKQARGAYGQGRMEAIIRDALPSTAYAFQATLSNRTRPDCTIRLPGDGRPMVIDAKFPLEAFTAYREASDADALKAAAARVRTDVGRHVRDIAERYLLPGETQEVALLFVPSESLFADLHEHFEEVVQRAHRMRVMIVSPSLLVLAVQVMQGLVRDALVREQAHLIQAEVVRLLDDVGRLRERVGKLSTHFRQATEDVAGIVIAADKIGSRAERIELMDFSASGTSVEPGRAAAE